MIPRLYELLTGRPWTTTRSMSTEYGPPPGAVYATQLAAYTDRDLILHGDRILAHLRARDTGHQPPTATGSSRRPRTAGSRSGGGPRVSPATPTHHLMSDHHIDPHPVDTP